MNELAGAITSGRAENLEQILKKILVAAGDCDHPAAGR